MPAPEPQITLARRRELGAFYTPRAVADALVTWAVSRETSRIFDPSFGDGRFLGAAAERLRGLGARAPAKRLFGVELNPEEAARPAALSRLRVPAAQLVAGDFFSVDLDFFGGQRFDAIIGNPPYVRHHLLSPESRRMAQAHARRVGITLNERADNWAYFCAALLDYLEPNGRLAILLPGAILHAEYALPLLHALSRARGRTHLVRVQQQLFEDAVERTVVLLIDGRHREPGVHYREVADLAELQAVLSAKPGNRRGWRRSASIDPEPAQLPSTRVRTRLRWFLSPEVETAWEEATALEEVRCLGDVAKIRIGVVTGANKFFVVNSARARELVGRSRYLRTVPAISRGGWLTGLRWTAADQVARAAHPSRLLLIDGERRMTRALDKAVTDAERNGLHTRSHCAARTKWYCLEDARVPQLFLPYMGATAPRLVINQADATCTNAVHRIDVHDGQAGAAAVAAASWTSLYRLSAELFGRSYGSGVLKLELGEAAQLRLALVPDGARHAQLIEQAWRENGISGAREIADRLLLEQALGLSRGQVALLREAAEQLQSRRGH